MPYCVIILDPLKPVYYPGDILNGYVLINLPKDKKINKISLEADGRAYVKFSNKYDKHGSTHSGENVYLKDHLTLWKKNKVQNEWDTNGNGKYFFSFVIPSDAAPSVECIHGFVRYRLKVELNLSWTLDKTYEIDIKVGIPIDLNSLPTYTQPQSATICKNGLFSLSKSTLAVVSIPRLVWTVGEAIPVCLKFTNDSSNDVSAVEITIIKKENYTGATAHEKHCKVTSEFIKRLNPMKYDIRIPAFASKEVVINVQAPVDCVTVDNCPIIKVDYELEVKINFKGMFSSPLFTSLPVIFSNIPLAESPPSQVSALESQHRTNSPPPISPAREQSPTPSSTPTVQPTPHPESPTPNSVHASNTDLPTSNSTPDVSFSTESSHILASTPLTENEKMSPKVTNL